VAADAVKARADLQSPRGFVHCDRCGNLRPIDAECCKPVLVEKVCDLPASVKRARAEQEARQAAVEWHEIPPIAPDNGVDKPPDSVRDAVATTTDMKTVDREPDIVIDIPVDRPIPAELARLADATHATFAECMIEINQTLTEMEPIWFIQRPEHGKDVWQMPKCLIDDGSDEHKAEHTRIEKAAESGEYAQLYLCRECEHPTLARTPEDKPDEEHRYCERHKGGMR